MFQAAIAFFRPVRHPYFCFRSWVCAAPRSAPACRTWLDNTLGLADQHARLGVSLKPILPLFAGLVAFALALIAVPPTIEARSLSGLLGLVGFVALVRHQRAADEAVVRRIFRGRLALLVVRLLAVPGA